MSQRKAPAAKVAQAADPVPMDVEARKKQRARPLDIIQNGLHRAAFRRILKEIPAGRDVRVSASTYNAVRAYSYTFLSGLVRGAVVDMKYDGHTTLSAKNIKSSLASGATK